MCMICAARRPGDVLSALDFHETAPTPTAASRYSSSSLDPLVDQLTRGYWAYSGEEPRAFDVAPGGTLTYDLGDLSAAEAHVARAAMEAWGNVTGLRFAKFSAPTLSSASESGDAPSFMGGAQALGMNQRLSGELSFNADSDLYRVRLEAGKTYHFQLEGSGAFPLEDPLLRLMNASGDQVAFNDDFGGGRNSYIEFTATSSGTYFLEVESYNTSSTGTYRLSVTNRPLEAHLTFSHSDPEGEGGAYSTSETDGQTLLSSFINIEQEWDPDPISINSYWYQTYLHEIGHALGLGHSGDYNGDAQWGRDDEFANDSWQTTVMSYFSQEVNTNVNASEAYVLTPMMADIRAIRELYGEDVRAFHGNTTYGANSNVGGFLGRMFGAIFDGENASVRDYIGNNYTFNIFDTGGRDRLDLSTEAFAVRINLAPGAASSASGLRNNILIAHDTIIEEAVGGRGADRIAGNAAANRLWGGNGADSLSGGNGRDVLIGGGGNDVLRGGGGYDTVAYGGSAALRIDLAEGTGRGSGNGSDRLFSIENAIGGRGADVITGTAGRNLLNGGAGNDLLSGGRGNDILRGGAGGDRLSGGAGVDTALYTGSADLRINLAVTTAQSTGQGRDRLQGIENVTTGSGDDVLRGNAGANRLIGGAGDDRLNGAGGNDVLVGGGGADRFVFTGGRDVVNDFRLGIDTLAFDRDLWGRRGSADAMLDDLATRTSSGHLRIDFGDGDVVILRNVTNADRLADDILFL